MAIEPIKPKGWVIPQATVIRAELDRLGRQTTVDVKRYPPWRPWKNPPKSGPHKGGRRTGALGRSWRYTVQAGGNRLVLTVNSQGVRYARWVQGRDQTVVMSGRDWKTIMAVFAVHVPEAQRRMSEWAKLKPA